MSLMISIGEKKKEIRRHFVDMRKSISAEDKAALDSLLFEKTVSQKSYIDAEYVLVYYPIKNEPDILRIAEDALKKGKKVAFPRSNTKEFTLDFGVIDSLDELVCGAYSIPEPSSLSVSYVDNDKTLCIVPGLAFDRNGKRIGYGKGYYDRFLKDFGGVSVGLCYSQFLVDSLPVDDYDISVDIIISDKEEIFINGKQK